MDVPALRIHEALSNLALEARSLSLLSDVSTVHTDNITPLSFYRDYVAPNIPVKITEAINHWPALKKWGRHYLKEQIGDEPVTVAVTPDGYADAITDGKFMLPAERVMKFSTFIEELSTSAPEYVCYVQKQNSNMTEEFHKLMDDVDCEISWASKAFGQSPDAVNFWMGDERAVTSMHKDHYENLYCVVKGQKTFTLIPPTDQAFVQYTEVPVSTYLWNEDKTFSIEDSTDFLPWITVDPLKPDLVKCPEYVNAQTITVTVNEGEMLYLPSLWFHHVQQSHGCIAVNFWYDMQYDIKYNYYTMVSSLTSLVKEHYRDTPPASSSGGTGRMIQSND